MLDHSYYRLPLTLCPLCEWRYIGRRPVYEYRKHFSKEHGNKKGRA